MKVKGTYEGRSVRVEIVAWARPGDRSDWTTVILDGCLYRLWDKGWCHEWQKVTPGVMDDGEVRKVLLRGSRVICCTCLDNQCRKRACKHMDASRQVVEMF